MFLLPDLSVGETYREVEVRRFIAPHGEQREGIRSDDYTAAIGNFPHRSRKRRHKNTEMYAEGKEREIVIEYGLLPIERFRSWFRLVETKLTDSTDEHRATQRARIHAIKERLQAKEFAYPIWIEKHLVNEDPMAVWEGTHRVVAFRELGFPEIPAFLLKYADKSE